MGVDDIIGGGSMETPMEIFKSEDGAVQVNVIIEKETAWLTQAAMAKLFGVGTQAITKHLKNIYSSGELQESATCSKMEQVREEGGRIVRRKIDFYNLDAIIAVGYRVNSARATQFRIWATKILKDYIIKGFALDDERMKTGRNTTYFDELQARIREIRLSERVFYQKVKDIYATSVDYDPTDFRTLRFFKIVQNKLLWAISKETAAELVVHRANPQLPFMGMSSYDKKIERRITKQDAVTAKNYLTESEIKDLGLLVEQYLAFAEAQANRHIAMTMDDWIAKLDGILTLNGRELLKNAGRISHEVAEETAALRLEEFKMRLRQEEKRASIEELERDLRELEDDEDKEKNP